MWGSQFQNHNILFLTDNETVVAIINKTSSKDKNHEVSKEISYFLFTK